MTNGMNIEPYYKSIGEIFYKDQKFTKIQKYHVPVYQREYDWDKEQIDSLIEKLCQKYFKDSKNKEIDIHTFIGSMEFQNRDNEIKQIVDGQQRITTILLLLNILKPEKFDSKFILNILKAGKNNDKQDKLEQYLENQGYNKLSKRLNSRTGSTNSDRRQAYERMKNENVYKRNGLFIRQKLAEQMQENNLNFSNLENMKEKEKFIEYILRKVNVVSIEIGKDVILEDVIDIFNGINTEGKELETADIFKIRLVEYMRRNGKLNDEAINTIFESVNKLYADIKDTSVKICEKEEKIREIDIQELHILGKNKSVNLNTKINNSNIPTEVFDINDILKVYQYIIISKMTDFDAVKSMKNPHERVFSMSQGRFFDDVFSKTIDNLKVESLEKFDKKQLETNINVKLLDEIYKAYKIFNLKIITEQKIISAEAYFAYKIFRHYVRCQTGYFLPILFYWKFKKINNDFIINLSKLLQINSISFNQVRSSNEIHGMLNKIAILIVNADDNNSNNEIKSLNKYIVECIKKTNRPHFEENLTGDVAFNSTNKRILCYINAKNAEDKDIEQKNISKNDKEKEKMIRYQGLFIRKIDIEHISAKESQKSKLDEESINTLGNLMILEYSINRSIQEKDIEDKITNEKGYKDSSFAIVEEKIKSLSGINSYYKLKKYYDKRQQEMTEEIREYFKY